MEENNTSEEKWQEVGGLNAHNFDEEPVLTGTLDRMEENKWGSKDYVIRRENGTEVIVFNKAVLHSKLSRIEPGTPVRITALGQQKSEKTGRTYQNFKVETPAE